MAHELFLGRLPSGGGLCLTPRARSCHCMIAGAPRSGKTTTMENSIRADIRAGRGVCLVDPQDALYHRALAYCASRGVDAVLLEPASVWVTGFDPVATSEVEQLISLFLTAWGEQSSDEMPRLERNLRGLFTAIKHKGQTLLEAPLILQSALLRARTLEGMSPSLVTRQLADLFSYSMREFQAQTESTMNRFMRFDETSPLGLMFGVGRNEIDLLRMMDEGKVLLVNLGGLDEVHQRIIGLLIIDQLYAAAMSRRKGARPFFLYLDEAGLFATSKLGDALDRCRQRGLHITFAFQHLGQFAFDNPKAYRSIKNSVGTKLLFRMNSRQEALEMVDDMVPGLAEAEVKHQRWDTVYVPETKYLPSFSAGLGFNFGNGNSRDTSKGKAVMKGTSQASSVGENTSRSRGGSHGHGVGVREFPAGFLGSMEPSESHYLMSSDSSIETASDGSSYATILGTHEAEALSEAERQGSSNSFGFGLNFGLGLQPTTIHRPERKVVQETLYTLEERRWKAAEEVMSLAPGTCLIHTMGVTTLLRIPRPAPHWTKPAEVLAFRERLFEAHSVPRHEAARIILDRHQALLAPQSDPQNPLPRRSKKPS